MIHRGEAQLSRLARAAGYLFVVLAAGCAGMDRAPQEPAKVEGAQGKAPAPKPAEVKPDKPVVAKPVQVAPRPDAPVVTSPEAPVAHPEASAKPVAKAAATPTPKEPAPKKEVVTPPAPKPSAPTLDLAGLEKRLKETPAIGVFTKLTLKNQVDALLEQFRGFYQGRSKTTLAQLRQPYEQLILKVLSLLQDSDPPLAREIAQSREVIWGILSDPSKFDDL